MSILDDNVDELYESLDDLLLDSDLKAPDSMECDDIAPALAPDIILASDQSDSDLSDDGEAENTWMDDAQKHDRCAFSEPVGFDAVVVSCETPLQFNELFFSEELFAMIADQTNLYGQEKRHDWRNTDTSELKTLISLCLQMSRCPLDNRRNYW
ncbi:unnamed protein product [Heligmosomoides polygyrus]|uniref:DDE_Tnp_1_7 domain-containing protein n=1 Tax=Heligmosomoides polygyrus TaxID=6339 RepID=A0A183FML9_HELPZ|nr:unnamed protein product [Heligmosomoides polygyrus]